MSGSKTPEEFVQFAKSLPELPAGVSLPPPASCAWCSGELGRRYWADVPGIGDLCVSCHDAWLRGARP